MRITKIASFALMLICANFLLAQDDDLLKSLDSGTVEPKKEMNVGTAFKALQVVNMQSTKTPAKHELYMIVSHRFGALGGENVDFLDNFFGMDKATTKIGFIYGINNWLSLGISRQTPKLYELTAKYRFAVQSDKMPVTLVGYHSLNANTALKKEAYPNIKFNDKLSYTSQLLMSRMVTDKLSLQLSGIWVHKNLIDVTTEKKDDQIVTAGGRFKISNRVSINGEYGYRINPSSTKSYYNPVSLGVDIDTGGHVFQLVLSNSQKMSEVGYYTNTSGEIGEGGIFFGFNMYRVF
jgi:hypothetical protein